MDVEATPRTNKAFNGDLSVGLFPQIHTFWDAENFARHLEIELNRKPALYEAALKAAVARHDYVDGAGYSYRLPAEAEFAALRDKSK